MKQKSKLLALVLALVFAFTMFALAACGDDDPPAKGDVSITLSQPTVNLSADEESSTHKATISATVKGTKDKAKWSVADSAVATIQYQGNTCEITGVAEGSTTVTATVGNKTAECTVNVAAAPKPAITIALDKPELNLTKGEAATEVTATLTNAEDGATVTWSLANGGDAVVTITPNGNKVSVLPIAVGTTKLTAKIGDVTKTIDVTVVKAPVTLTLDKEKVELEYDPAAEEAETATVTATVTNTDEKVVWSIASDDIATITPSEDGLSCTVTAEYVGMTTLKATVDGKTATIPVKVNPAEGVVVEGELTIDVNIEHGIIIEKGETLEINATVKGSLVQPTWSIEYDEEDEVKDVVTLSATTGMSVTLTAVRGGLATLKVTIGEGEKETIEVDLGVIALEVDKTEIVLVNDENDNNYTAVITATVEPEYMEVGWDVPGGEEAVVTTVEDKENHTLTVTANKVGTATIYATLGEIKREITVTVKAPEAPEIPVTISVDPTELELKEEGENKTIEVTVGGTEDDYAYEITGENTDCITVAKSGNTLTVTPVKPGTATVKVTVGDEEATCAVTVTAKEEEPSGTDIEQVAGQGDANTNNDTWHYFLDPGVQDGDLTVNSLKLIGDKTIGKGSKIVIDYSYTGPIWTALNLYYSMQAGAPTGYEVKFTFKSSVNGWLTVNGNGEEVFEIKAGENTIVKDFGGAALWLRFGSDGRLGSTNAPIVGKFEIIDLTVGKIVAQKLATPSFTYDEETGIITITDTDNADIKDVTYKMNFYQNDSLIGSSAVESGKKVEPAGLEVGDYTAKLVAVGDGIRYTDSDESEESATVKVESLNTSVPLRTGDISTAQANKGEWVVWEDTAFVTLTEAVQDSETGAITISFTYNSNNKPWHGMRLCYAFDGPVLNYVKMNIHVETACEISIAEVIVALEAGDNEVYVSTAKNGAVPIIGFGSTNVDNSVGQTYILSGWEFTNDAPPAAED